MLGLLPLYLSQPPPPPFFWTVCTPAYGPNLPPPPLGDPKRGAVQKIHAGASRAIRERPGAAARRVLGGGGRETLARTGRAARSPSFKRADRHRHGVFRSHRQIRVLKARLTLIEFIGDAVDEFLTAPHVAEAHAVGKVAQLLEIEHLLIHIIPRSLIVVEVVAIVVVFVDFVVTVLHLEDYYDSKTNVNKKEPLQLRL
ncbi:hypothetical protein T492DRAFT_70818 [Pavlovales sp. CCMP2436]|nr:hypothetical protein T492DRAFT_70818 [Pavlovales sp. CCMP2436]